MKIFGTILVIGVMLGAAFFIFSRESGNEVTSQINSSETRITALTFEKEQEIIPAGYKKYQNAKYGFSILYPETLAQKEIDEGGNASTITFQNPAEGKGFQIFVVPYSGGQISEERFRSDVPSGVRKNIEEVTVDGAKGAAFYSMDAFLGETREVWFIKNGYLFEVTTLKALEADLLEVLRTWKFI